jgi:hypothetical protein
MPFLLKLMQEAINDKNCQEYEIRAFSYKDGISQSGYPIPPNLEGYPNLIRM